jgi:hypothetical protein
MSVQILPPLLQRPRKRGLSVFGDEITAGNFCPGRMDSRALLGEETTWRIQPSASSLGLI